MRVENKVINPYTIMCMVGPTASGKSHWVNELHSQYPNLRVISSDKERKNILNTYFLADTEPFEFRYSPEMMRASESAFHLLKAKVEAYCMYGTQHILVDTTGTPATTDLIKDIASEYNYSLVAIIMDLPKAELTKYAQNKSISERSIKTFKNKSLANLKGFNERLQIKARDCFPTLIEESKIYLDTFSVIGDIHQSIDKAKELIKDLEGTLIFVGDYFDTKDKSNNYDSISKTLDFLEDQIKQGNYLLKGNHENYIYGRLLNNFEACQVEADYFNSVPIFKEYEDLQDRFFNVFQYFPDYIKLESKGIEYHITHAPVSRKYRCKPKNKFNYKCTYPENNLYDYFQFVKDNSGVVTICGHVAHRGTLKPYYNNWFIDTGAAYGGQLSALVCTGSNKKVIQVGEPLLTLPSIKQPKELLPEQKYTVNRLIKEGCRFISGTMPPAPSANNRLESLDVALEYFKELGIREIVLDKKFMGSRCNAYVTEEEVILKSRSGVVIKFLEEIPISLIKSVQLIRKKLGAKSIILDGELMPWSALGQGLIEEYESKLWIYENLNKLGFNKEGIKETQEVLKHFSSQEAPYFVPFSILEIEWENGNIEYPEWDWNTVSIKLALEDSNYKILTTDDIEEANEFFEDITINKHLEGIVIKPLLTKHKKLIPYMKVRGTEYLRLVYGPDYPLIEKELASNKSITNKVKIAVEQWNLGKALLMTTTTEQKEELILEMLGHIDKEKTLDPRL